MGTPAHEGRPSTETRNVCAGPFGAVYDYYIERPRLARLVLGLTWGVDPRPFYRSLAAVGEMPDGATILDVPCGGGVALRGLHPGSTCVLDRCGCRACDAASGTAPCRAIPGGAGTSHRRRHDCAAAARTASLTCASAMAAFTACPIPRRRSPRWRAVYVPVGGWWGAPSWPKAVAASVGCSRTMTLVAPVPPTI